MILKIVLLIIGIILGLVVLFLLLLLFCPVRYRLHVAKEETASLPEAKADAKVSWLFGGAAVGVSYQEKKPSFSVRLLGIPLDKLLFRKKTPEIPEKVPESIEETEAQELQLSTAEPKSGPVPEESKTEISVQEPEQETAESETEEAVPDEIRPPEPIKEEGPSQSEPESGIEEAEESDEETAPADKVSLFERIRGILSGIIGKIRNALDKAKAAMTQLSWWKNFLFHERTKAAIALVLKETKGLIRHVLPTKMYGNLAFGFEDPSITGRITGALAMTIPFHRNRVQVQPSFECRSFAAGDVTVKGRIYGIAFVAAGIKLLVSRNIRFVLKKLKNRNKQDHKEE